MKTLLVTGSSGLIGSEICVAFHELGYAVHGVDNNQRAVFFGPAGDTRFNQHRLQSTLARFTHHELDVRDRQGVMSLLAQLRPTAVVHTAAQPSHDRATAIPLDDFDTNAVGTLNLLESARRHCPQSPFVYMSTNKVYGDRPNTIPLAELPNRWDYADPRYAHGIPEDFSIDQCFHSVFGASKVAADVMTQEYGRLFQLPTCCLRGGCLTGPNHAGVELHGFLSYLVKCNVEQKPYNIYGYKGKQVRDNIHARDVAAFIVEFINAPRPAEVYNIGGGKPNACSILEAFELAKSFTGKSQVYSYQDQNRAGDHICYYSDLRKMQAHYPRWRITVPLDKIVHEIAESWMKRTAAAKP